MAAETDPSIKVPLDRWVEQIADRAAERAARKVIDDHEKRCSIFSVKTKVDQHDTQLNKLEKNWAWLLGVMVGSGMVGGAAGGWLSSLFR
ncbi:MAG TPA: hypothetical protein VM243_10520 [Phycisphaerae bacterium]|nr:hypothetical protein [Phycisphaerae bacterium]